MTEEKRSSSPSATGIIKIAEAKAGLVSRIVTGIFFMLLGGAAIVFGVKLDNHSLLIGGACGAVFGAMVLPSVFDTVKPIVVFFFPNGVPFIGGRRAGDPPAPPAPPSA